MKTKGFLSGDAVCSIVDACAKSKVSHFRWGNLEFCFSGSLALEPSPFKLAPEYALQEQIEKDEIEREEISTREDQIAELWITNPAKAEEMLEQGELDLSSTQDSEQMGEDS